MVGPAKCFKPLRLLGFERFVRHGNPREIKMLSIETWGKQGET
jgi:hypothetical protein